MKSFTVVVSSVFLTYLFTLLIHWTLPDQPIPSDIEITATATGLACVWWTRLENVLCWPVGIVSAILLAFTYFDYDLPGQAWLQLLYYVPVSFYGWHMWRKKEWLGQWLPSVSVSQLPFKYNLLMVAAGFAITATVAMLLTVMYGDPLYLRYWDASILVASVFSQWLLNRKRVEAWWGWCIPVNVSSVILYAHQGAYMYMLMYVVFFVHSVLALKEWRIKCRLNAA